MLGTEKQIRFAVDIKRVVISTLIEYLDIRKDLEIYINKTIAQLDCIQNSVYIIEHLRDVCYTKDFNKKMDIIEAWLRKDKSLHLMDFANKMKGMVFNPGENVEKYQEHIKKIHRVGYKTPIEVIYSDF